MFPTRPVFGLWGEEIMGVGLEVPGGWIPAYAGIMGVGEVWR